MRFRSEPGPRAADSGVFRRPGDAIEQKGLGWLRETSVRE